MSFTNREQGHLKRLQARCDVLNERLKSAVGDAALQATQELRAIGWAMDTLKMLRSDGAEACEARSESEHRTDPATSSEVVDALVDAERYRWFRDQCEYERRVSIAEAGTDPLMLEHHIDKGRCGL